MNPFKTVIKMAKRLQKWYLDLRMLGKLAISFGLITIIVLIIAGIGQVSLAQVNATLDSVITNELEPLVYLHDIRSYISELEITTRDAIMKRDADAIRYVQGEFLPNTVSRTVDYSFGKLLEKPSGDPERVRSLQGIKEYWGRYEEHYRRLLAQPSLLTDTRFMQEGSNIRFFLVGGIDRLVETDYRQKAVLAGAQSAELFLAQQWTTSILLLLLIIIVIGLSLMTAFVIVNPMTRLAEASRRIAQGELDTVVDEERTDEFGEVAQCFNLMIHELRRLLAEIKDAAFRVNYTNQKVLQGTIEGTGITRQLADALATVAEGADVQQSQIESVYAVLQSVTASSGVVNDFTKQVKQLAADSFQTAIKGGEIAREVREQMQQVREITDETRMTMSRLQGFSNEIESMAGLVKEIADQTNLLSLNARIEAARAGEHGRGFSIVAASIGGLSEQTKVAAEKVENLVSSIHLTFDQMVLMIFKENRIVSESEASFNSLNEAFDAITEGVQCVNRQLNEVSRFTAQLNQDHDKVLQAVSAVTEIAARHKRGTIEATSAAASHYTYSQEVIKASQVLSAWSENLNQAVNRFKTKIAPVPGPIKKTG